MDMQKLQRKIQAYCAEAGISHATFCLSALNNARFFDRLKRRLEKDREDAEKVMKYIKANPANKRKKPAASSAAGRQDHGKET